MAAKRKRSPTKKKQATMEVVAEQSTDLHAEPPYVAPEVPTEETTEETTETPVVDAVLATATETPVDSMPVETIQQRSLFPDAEAETATTHCPACKTPLVNVLQHALCPNGCGKLWPKLPIEVSRKNTAEAKIAVLPKCSAVTSMIGRVHHGYADSKLYVIDGEKQFFRRVPRPSQSLEAAPEGGKLAYQAFEDRVLALMPATAEMDDIAIVVNPIVQSLLDVIANLEKVIDVQRTQLAQYVQETSARTQPPRQAAACSICGETQPHQHIDNEVGSTVPNDSSET